MAGGKNEPGKAFENRIINNYKLIITNSHV